MGDRKAMTAVRGSITEQPIVALCKCGLEVELRSGTEIDLWPYGTCACGEKLMAIPQPAVEVMKRAGIGAW